jgi:2-polyprenyl-3-methyl-5-hydroxy-6-metoxy-1,4-benzoquinol methylase
MWSSPGIEAYYDRVRQSALTEFVIPKDKVLDVGCGLYGSCQYLAEHSEKKMQLYAIDFSFKVEKYMAENFPGIVFKNSNIYPLPYASKSMDYVIAGEVIEHMENPKLFVSELCRICKPGGWITLSTVNNHCANAQKCQYAEHIWEFTPEDLISFFKPFGKTTYRLVGDYHFIECQKI